MICGHACTVAIVVGLSLVAGRASAVVQLTADSVTVGQPGEAGSICVSLDSGGAQVAGTQNDLAWDGDCATLPSSASCQVNPATGKQLQGGFPPRFDFTYRALVLSLSDVDPIPNGQLYCCRFVAEAEPGRCCPIRIVRAGASDPRGNLLATRGNTAEICVAGGSGTPRPTSTPIPGFGDDDSGCQVDGAAGTTTQLAWIALPLALLCLARRRALSSSVRARANRR